MSPGPASPAVRASLLTLLAIAGAGCGARSGMSEPTSEPDAALPALEDSGRPDARAGDGGTVTPGCSSDPAGGWEVETVAAAGVFPSLAVGGDGTTWVAFVMDGDQVVATRDGGSWVVRTVEAVRYTDLGPDIALDRSGAVHLAFNTYVTESGAIRELRYGRLLGPEWSVETVPSNTCVVAGLTVDAASAAHVVCGLEDVDYATNTGGAWTVETAVVGGGTSGHVAVDSKGIVHVASGDRLFARRDGWVREATLPGQAIGLVFDSADVPHVAFTSPGTGFGHAFQTEGTIEIEILDPRGGSGGSAPVAVDSSDFVHVAYAVEDAAGCEVWYATNATGEWVGEQIDGRVVCRDDDHRWFTRPSVAVDPFEVHVVYASKAGICHAYRTP